MPLTATLTATLLALMVLLGSSVTIINLDDAAALKPLGILVTEDRQMHILSESGAHSVTLADGTVRSTRLVDAALGCHGSDDIRYYRRTPALFRADHARLYPGQPFAQRVRSAHASFVKTEVHELLHALHCSTLGDVSVAPTRAQARAMFESAALNPDDWNPRPATWSEAYEILTDFDPGTWGSVGYCWSDEAEWFACLGTAAATAR